MPVPLSNRCIVCSKDIIPAMTGFWSTDPTNLGPIHYGCNSDKDPDYVDKSMPAEQESPKKIKWREFI